MPDPQTTKEESGWLIERGESLTSRPEYFIGVSDVPGFGFAAWHEQHQLAARFCRQQDAMRVAEFIDAFQPPEFAKCRVCEHGWGP